MPGQSTQRLRWGVMLGLLVFCPLVAVRENVWRWVIDPDQPAQAATMPNRPLSDQQPRAMEFLPRGSQTNPPTSPKPAPTNADDAAGVAGEPRTQVAEANVWPAGYTVAHRAPATEPRPMGRPVIRQVSAQPTSWSESPAAADPVVTPAQAARIAHLRAELERLGATYYKLQAWGPDGLSRCHCRLAIPHEAAGAWHLEAMASDPVMALEQVVDQARRRLHAEPRQP